MESNILEFEKGDIPGVAKTSFFPEGVSTVANVNGFPGFMETLPT